MGKRGGTFSRRGSVSKPIPHFPWTKTLLFAGRHVAQQDLISPALFLKMLIFPALTHPTPSSSAASSPPSPPPPPGRGGRWGGGRGGGGGNRSGRGTSAGGRDRERLIGIKLEKIGGGLCRTIRKSSSRAREKVISLGALEEEALLLLRLTNSGSGPCCPSSMSSFSVRGLEADSLCSIDSDIMSMLLFGGVFLVFQRILSRSCAISGQHLEFRSSSLSVGGEEEEAIKSRKEAFFLLLPRPISLAVLGGGEI